MKRRINMSFVVLVVALIRVAPVFAQTAATLTGRVVDPQGAGVPGASVTLYARDHRVRLTTSTDATGVYRFERLALGSYLVEAEAPGFARTTARELRVEHDRAVTLEIQLQLAGVRTEVIITASGTPQLIDEVSKAISVVTDDEIDQRDEFSLGEALRSSPGLRVQQLGGPGAFTTIKTRGLRNEDTAVLIDGFRFRDAASTQGDVTAFLQDLMVVNTNRLEVLRGAGSSLYGSHAIGGVVNVVTEAGGGRPRGQFQLEGGSLGLFRGRATFAGGLANDRLLYSAGLAHLNVAHGVDGDDPARNTSGQMRLQYNLTPSLSLTGRIFATGAFLKLNDSPFAAPNQSVTPPPLIAIALALDQQRLREAGQPFVLGNANFIPALDDPDNSRSSDLFAGAFTLAHRVGEALTYRLSYSGVDTERIFRDGPAGVRSEPQFNNRTDIDGRTDTFEAQAQIGAGGFNFVTAGYEFEREQFRSRSRDPNTDTLARVTQRSHTLFVQDQIRLLADRLQFSVAGRVQSFDLSRPVFTPSTFSPYASAHIESSKTAYTGDASTAYFITRAGTKLRAHAGSGYRVPSSFERFGSTFFAGAFSFFGDPRLGPERSISFDGGIDQTLIGNRLRASATYFYTRLQEVIVFDSSGGINPAIDPFRRSGGYRNTGGGLARGVELSVTAAPTRTLDLSAAYTYTNANARDPNATGTTRLFGISDHLFSLQAYQCLGRRIGVGFDLIAYSEYAAPLSGRAYIFKGPVKADLGFSYKLPLSEFRSIRLYGKVENLFDREYFENGFRTPGRVGVAGVTFHF
jgi:vitamin B12 transporter